MKYRMGHASACDNTGPAGIVWVSKQSLDIADTVYTLYVYTSLSI